MATRGALFVLGAVVLLVGCGRTEEDTTNVRRPGGASSSSGGTDNPAGAVPPGSPAPLSAAVTACNAVAAPTALSDAKDATEVQIAGKAVFFRTGQSVERTLKDGTNKKTVFTSPNLVKMFADSKGLLLVEQTGDGNPTATLRGYAATVAQVEPGQPPPPDAPFPEFPVPEGEDKGGTTAGTNFNAPSAKVFGADATNYYVLADDNNNGNALIIKIDRATLAQTNLVNEAVTIKNPILSGNTVYWVQEDQRIKKLTLASEEAPQGTPTEIFGLGQCNLAINESNAFCSVGGAIETRDLTGQNAKTLIAAAQSKSAAPFGVVSWSGGKLYVRSGAPDAEVKHFIRAIGPAGTDESFVACKREQVVDFAADATDIVWAEQGTGVFMAAKN